MRGTSMVRRGTAIGRSRVLDKPATTARNQPVLGNLLESPDKAARRSKSQSDDVAIHSNVVEADRWILYRLMK